MKNAGIAIDGAIFCIGIAVNVVKGLDDSPNPPFWKAVLTAGAAGAAGGVVGTPADLVNVRMQNDMKLPVDKRRNYKNAIDGLIRVAGEEGPTKMFSGLSMATSRAVFMTIGQLSFYDLFKKVLLDTNYFTDSPSTHFLASLMAGGVATTLTQPLDVMKTRAMNAKPGEFKGLTDIFLYTAKLGPLGFFKVSVEIYKTRVEYLGNFIEENKIMKAASIKAVSGILRPEKFKTYKGLLVTFVTDASLAGMADVLSQIVNDEEHQTTFTSQALIYVKQGYVPAFVRLAPQTILTFLFLEQLKVNFG